MTPTRTEDLVEIQQLLAKYAVTITQGGGWAAPAATPAMTAPAAVAAVVEAPKARDPSADC